MTDKMQEEFEKWALTECFDLTAVGGFYSDNETDAAYKAWQACAARMVPEGFVMVPVEPTEKMLKAGERGIGVSSYVRKGMTIREYCFFKSGWDAMLAAAPEGKK